MMMRTILSALLAGLLSLSCAAAEDVSYERIRFERLPDMKTPRAGHLMLVTGNEITVFGGHTDGFNPVGTAESFRNGTWYSLQMSWPHDGGCFAVLPDGRVFLGGGSAESFGIGQSWGAEIYDPETHGFHPIGIMDRRRAYASALTLPDGKIVIAGNWYAEDGVALYDPGEGFLPLKNLPVGWNAPYILPASPDEAVIFGREDNYGNPAYGRVDRLRGDTLHVSLLEDWTVKVVSFLEENLKIADYTYLLPIERSSDGQIGILKVSEGHFSLLETDTPFPVKGPFGGPVNWTPWFQVKRSLRQAWMLGYDVKGRICLARIDYDATFDGGKAGLRLFYAEDASGAFPQGRVCLMPDGSLLMSGGVERDLSRPNEIAFTNFQTSAAVYRFYPDQFRQGGFPFWLFSAIIFLAAGGLLLLIVLRRRKKVSPLVPVGTNERVAGETVGKLSTDLMGEIDRLIMKKELFKQKDLRVSDIASLLATNQTYISLLVNNLSGNNFASLISGYRIRYAQELMRKRPDMPHADVAEAAGFSSRTAFLRTFKAQTGLTPSEWKRQEGLGNVF